MSEKPPRPTLTVIEGGKAKKTEEMQNEIILAGEVKHMASNPDNDTFDFSNLPPLPERGSE